MVISFGIKLSVGPAWIRHSQYSQLAIEAMSLLGGLIMPEIMMLGLSKPMPMGMYNAIKAFGKIIETVTALSRPKSWDIQADTTIHEYV